MAAREISRKRRDDATERSPDDEGTRRRSAADGSDDSYDVIVIGGGPAGTTAAIRAAQLDLRTLCVDERSRIGGTCLNIGCIPSKALLDSTERLSALRNDLAPHGISLEGLSVQLDTMMSRKDAVVQKLTSGLGKLMDTNGVERVRGRGRLLGAGRVGVSTGDGNREVKGRHILIATGSTAATLEELPVDHDRVLTSTDALSLAEVPEHLAIVGGGYIGLELGSVWKRLGADVTVIELEDRLVPQMDQELGEHVQRSLEEQDLDLCLGSRVDGVRIPDDDRGLVLELRGQADGEIHCSHVLVAIGRTPVTKDLGLETAGVGLDDDGFVRTDSRFRTTAPGVFAIGDVAGEPMLAHKGQLEAIACVDALAGLGSGRVCYDAVPSVVYTWPEIASLGATERELREGGVAYRTGRASFRHNGRALCTGESVGFVKLLADEDSDRLLGAHLFGPDAGTIVHELVLAVELGGSVEEIGRSVHAHPTLNESVREAALALHGRAIHQ